MSEYREDIIRLSAEARALPEGSVKIALLEEAVRLADAAQDDDERYRRRMELIDATMFGGRPDIGIVAFAWCLAYFDRRPDGLDERSLLWKYKWIVGIAAAFPTISLEQIFELFDDMKRRFRAFGAPHAVSTTGRGLMMKLGRIDEAEAFDEELAKTDRDMLSDCTSCVVSKTFSYLIAAERWGDALACYEKEMTPRLRCTHEPQRFLSHALTVLRRHGRLDDARDAHVKSYRHIARNPAFVYEWGDHVEHLALTDQVPAARRLVQKHVDAALTCFDPEDKYVFCTAAHICLEQIRRGGSKTVKLSLATPLEIGGNAKGYHTSELSRWFLAEAEAIAAQFDRRNGNDWIGTGLRKRIAQSA